MGWTQCGCDLGCANQRSPPHNPHLHQIPPDKTEIVQATQRLHDIQEEKVHIAVQFTMTDPRQGPPVPPKHKMDANGLTTQFEDLLRTRRLNDLAGRSQRRTESPEPTQYPYVSSQPPPHQTPRPPYEQQNALPAYSSLRNHPKIATPPQDSTSMRFCSQLRALSVRPTRYENPGLLDEALQVVPLDRIYGEAEDESSLLQAQAESIGSNTKPEWGHQDCVVRALMR